MMIKTLCHHCRKEFQRNKKEHIRSIKLKRKEYCSRQCMGKACCKHLGPHQGNTSKLDPGNRLDEFSPFRRFLKHAKSRSQIKEDDCLLTLPDIRNQWIKQKGVCAYTGWIMDIPPTTGYDNYELSPQTASLDRIDSAKGYTADNVHFVCFMANVAKNKFPEKDLIDFCHAVAKNRG